MSVLLVFAILTAALAIFVASTLTKHATYRVSRSARRTVVKHPVRVVFWTLIAVAIITVLILANGGV